MRKTILFCACTLILTAATGCRINIIRLNNRIERWESVKKKSSIEDKVKFARESLLFFLNTTDFQRGRETLVSEAERLTYHRLTSGMHVFLLDYHAGLALGYLEKGAEDWELAAAQWAKADTLARGLIPGQASRFRMVLLQKGYEQYLKEISAQGFRYDRMEKSWPGLMEAFRKMSEYQFRLAEHLYAQGLLDEAIEHYLLVFRRDPANFSMAENRVKYLTGRTIREIYDRRRAQEISSENYNNMRFEVFSSVDGMLSEAKHEYGDSAELFLPEFVGYAAET
ncbi:MAG: hypothetical protein U9N45_04490, partial [Gemmatimonadota bacterium]|nr:hypothetical protein [Gemmatimonadota bacterium]